MGAIPYIISEGTYINGGDYCGAWNLNDSPFLIEGTVNVPVDCELTIQHGVEIIFWYRLPFNVYGRLLAEGTSWDKITFTQAESGWNGIKFYNTNSNGQDSSLIEHAIIKYVFYADEHAAGGGLYFDHSSDVKIRNCEISNCFIVGDAGAYGAGILCDASSPQIQDIIIRDCETEGPATFGTAIYCHTNSNPEITRALIYNNNSDATDYARGGGIACVGSDPVLTNITITQSNMTGSNQYGGAIYADGADPVITNCIFYNNDNAEVYAEAGASPVITYSDIDGGTGQPWFGTGCIDDDPLFLDPGSYDFSLSWDNFPVPDATMSPCIDSGDPASANDPDGTQADMGTFPFFQAYWLCGNTKGTLTQSGSPYIVTCDVMVLSIDSLFIEPGVEVIFMDNYKLEVHGRLVAEGTETDSIHFRPFDCSIGWHGIRFFNTETNGKEESIIKYCDISGGLAFEGSQGDEWGGGILCYNSSDVEISNTTIRNNRAFGTGLGGGIYCYGSDITIDSVNLLNNYAGYAGGGIYLDDSDPVITRTIIAGNYASSTGAGIHIEENSSPEITNVTITQNTGAILGGGIYIFNTTPTIKNTIVWNNDNGAIGVAGTNLFDVTYSVVQGGWPGTGNVDGDPLFTDPSGMDFSLTWEDYPEPNETKSSCIDLGDPASPLDPDGTRAEIGAIFYEQTYTALPGGDISGTLYCSDSPYFVFGDLTVPTGDELIIEPCVYIVFQGDYKLTVNGRLLAEGTEPDRITIYPADTLTGWQGVRFINQTSNGQDSSKLVYCKIMYGNADGYGSDSYGGGLYFSSSSDVLIDNCYFRGNRAVLNGGAMCLTNSSSPDIRNSTFLNNSANSGGAIYCYDNVNTSFQNCYFSSNSANYGGAIAASSCGPEFSGSTIINNHAFKFGGGIYRDGGQAITFNETNRCSVYDNYADYAGLDFYSEADVYIPPVTQVYLDTASVEICNEHIAFPIHLFEVTSNNSRFVQEDSDLYVSPTGSDLNAGTSISYPLKTIKMALIKIISDNDDPRTIHLSDGIYSTSGTGEYLPINHRNHVTLSGESRDYTIIDGDSLYQLMISYADLNDLVKKLTFQNGYKNGSGGAVIIQNNSTPIFNQVTFSNNYCVNNGGAVWCYDDSCPSFSNTSFYSNYAGQSGGSIYIQSSENLIIDSCYFQDNVSHYSGGACHISYLTACTISNSTFTNDTTLNGYAGGCNISNSNILIYNTDFINCKSTGYGGALAFYGTDAEIINTRFNGNRATGVGGGIYFYHGNDLDLTNVIFSGNVSVTGGGIYGIYGSTLDIKNGLFYNNFSNYDPHLDGSGGAIYISNVTTNLTNITSYSNYANDNGGGLYSKMSDVNIHNSIFWDDTPSEISIESGTCTVEYSDIEGGYTGTGNLDTDPDFVNLTGGDFNLNTGSPCIDAGNPDTTGLSLPIFDLAGKPRICNDTVDMGAYEFFVGIELALKAFLEGAYNGIYMNTDLTILPLSQPYNESPWNYSGMENVFAIPNSDIVDWVLIELRDTTDASLATGETMIARFAGFLLNDGVVVGLDGDRYKACLVSTTITNNLFVVIWHRNHLGIMSANPVTESGGIYTYDFTTPAGQAYGTDAQKNLGGGVYGLYGGDGDANGTIDSDDKTMIWSVEAGSRGYLMGDFNMGSQTDNTDKNDIWINNAGNSSQIPD
jgi:predicted outer membrane repeat protein